MIFYCIITAFLNTCTSTFLEAAVLLRSRRSALSIPFFLFLLSGSAWSATYVTWLVSTTPGQALLWTRVLSAAAIFVPPTYHHFVVRLLEQRGRTAIIAGYAIAVVFAALSPTSLIVQSIGPIDGFPFWPRAGAAYPAYVLFFFAYPAWSWVKILRAMRRAAHARRNQLKFILIATTLGFIGGGTNFPYWFDIPIPPIGNGLIIPYVVGVAYAVIGLRILEVNYVVTKLATYVLAVVPLTILLPAAFWILYEVAGDPVHSTWVWVLASFFLAFAVFLLLPAFKRRLDDLLERTVLKPFLSGRDRMRELVYEVAGMRDENDMFVHSAEVVAGALGAGATFYIRGELDANYRRRASFDSDATLALPEELGEDDPILALARRHQRAVLIDEVASLDPGAWPAVQPVRRRRRAEAVVPVHADGYFFGILELGARGRHHVYSDIELSHLDSVCLQLGLHVRARQIERRANQTEKLISLGTLAAGLAHELRNPLVSIKTFAALLDEPSGDRDLQREFSSTVLRDVNRIESIVENVAAFATDRKVAFTWIRLEEVVRAAYEIARPSFVAAGVRFEFEPGTTPHVQGNNNQLTQVVLNLLNNAVQALGGRDNGCVTVHIRHRSGEGAEPSFELSVGDNGPGIDAEVLPRLFEPFTTTKATGDRARKGGMGLGLAIVKRIIDGHNGVIRVETEPGQGTTFTVVLPGETSEA